MKTIQILVAWEESFIENVNEKINKIFGQLIKKNYIRIIN
tara:strand:+ start:2019 stop:2138 length:120 start_codon:yes stop_codon:yes gene_type:complete